MTASDEHGLLGGRVRLVQPRDGLRATTDTVLLPAAVPARAGETVLDVGCGTGGAALCLAARVPGCTVVGIDRDAALVRFARQGARRSGLADRATFHTFAVGTPWPTDLGPFDHVMTNPPFNRPRGTAAPASARRKRAMVENPTFALDAWIAACLEPLRPRGSLTTIVRADRLGDVLAVFRGRAGSAVVWPIWPKACQPAKRVLVMARKGLRGPLALGAGLVLHDGDGRYAASAEAVLRHAHPIVLDDRITRRQD